MLTRRAQLKAAIALTLFAVASPRQGHAVLAVFDGASYGQLASQVKTSFEQLSTLQQQLTAQMRMLQSLPAELLPDISPIMDATNGLMQKLSYIQGSGASLKSQLDNVFPTTFTGQSALQIANNIAAMQQANRSANLASINMQNAFAASQPQVQDAIRRSVDASRGAQGPTAVGQATNELLATQSTQLGQIQSLMITSARQADMEALQSKSEAEADAAFFRGPPAVLGGGAKF